MFCVSQHRPVQSIGGSITATWFFDQTMREAIILPDSCSGERTVAKAYLIVGQLLD